MNDDLIDDPATTTQPSTDNSDLVDEATPHKKMGWGEYLGRGATGALPVASGIAGGALSSPLGPAATFGGAGLGYAGGREIEDLLNQYLFGDKPQNNAPIEAAKRVGKNIGLGALGELGGQLTGKAIGAVASQIPKVAPALAKLGFDTPAAVSQQYLKNPEAVQAALDRPSLLQKIADTLGNVRNDTGPAHEAAMSTLSNERVPMKGFEVDNAVNLLKRTDTPEAKKLAEKLESEYLSRIPKPEEPIIKQGAWSTNGADPDVVVKDPSGLLPDKIIQGEKNGSFKYLERSSPPSYDPVYNPAPAAPPPAPPESHYLTEMELHNVKKTLQDAGDWKSPLPSSSKASANLASGDLNTTLKNNNMDYATAMEDLAQNIQAKKDLASHFGIKRDAIGGTESGFVPTDRTGNAIDQLTRPSKMDKANVLNNLNELGYGNLEDDARNTLAKEYFNGVGRPNGSRRTLLGSIFGGAMGHATRIPGATELGTSIGAGAGYGIDKYSPQLSQKLLDFAAKPNSPIWDIMAKGGLKGGTQ